MENWGWKHICCYFLIEKFWIRTCAPPTITACARLTGETAEHIEMISGGNVRETQPHV